MRESIIENYLCAQVRERGGDVRKVQWIARRGAPDRLVLLPGRSFWVELKATGERAEPHQVREHERLRDAGMPVYVVNSLESVDLTLLS